MEIQTAVTIAAGSLVVVAVIMLAVCLKFTSAVNRLLGTPEALDAAPAAPAQPPFTAASPATPEPTPAAAPAALKLNGVEEPTAAMLMAIVADELGAAPEELRFLSIKAC